MLHATKTAPRSSDALATRSRWAALAVAEATMEVYDDADEDVARLSSCELGDASVRTVGVSCADGVGATSIAGSKTSLDGGLAAVRRTVGMFVRAEVSGLEMG